MTDGKRHETRVLAVQSDGALLDEVIALGDRNKRTLGPLPREVFRLCAKDGTLLAAVAASGELLGYALYQIGRGRVRLVHLCVEPQGRGSGIARSLVHAISDRHSDLPGIRVTCRSDYDAAALWPKLGFEKTNQLVGRGLSRKQLDVWWLQHDVPDLFSFVQHDDGLVVVAIDHNVFIDLSVQPERKGAEESSVLHGDYLSGVLRLSVTHETFREVERVPDPSEQARQRQLARTYHQLPSDHVTRTLLRARFLEALGTVRLDDSDLEHLLDAAAGGARVFVTRDTDLVADAERAAADALDVRVLRPADVIVHLAELQDAESFRPVAMNATSVTVQDTNGPLEHRLRDFISVDAGERRTAFRERLRAATAAGVRVRHVADDHGGLLVVWAEHRTAEMLSVSLIRTSRHPLAATVTRQLLFQLRSTALDEGLSSVHVTDPALAPGVIAMLAEDGFTQTGAEWISTVAATTSRAGALGQLRSDDPRRSLLMREDITASQAAELERQLWPAKMLDVDVPNWIIPIAPERARALLQIDQPIFARPDILGLSRELIFYRSWRGGPKTQPARILWYASGTGRGGIGAVVANSQLVEVDVDTPDALFRRHRRLGVYGRTQVRDAAGGVNGRAMALRFVNTEHLAPIHYETLVRLAGECPLGHLQSPVKIGNDLFAAIYERGTRHRE